MRVLTCGTFDLFHYGHLNLLKKCKELDSCVYLIVGVSSDELNYKKKGIFPILNLEQRIEMISSIKYVDEIFVEESLEDKQKYIDKYQADIFAIGDDWKDKFDLSCRVIYFPRTPEISSTLIRKNISGSKKVLIVGEFSIVHPGHYYLLEKAKSYGDVYIGMYTSPKLLNFDLRASFFAHDDRVKKIIKIKNIHTTIKEHGIDLILTGNTKTFPELEIPVIKIGETESSSEFIFSYLMAKRNIVENGKDYFPMLYKDCFASRHSHAILYRIFNGIFNVLEKYPITYTLTGGSLLGAERNQGLIPWDDDGDLSWIKPPVDVFEKIKKELVEDYAIHCRNRIHGRFWYQSFNKNHNSNYVDYFTVLHDGTEYYLEIFPKQRFKNFETEILDFGPIKARCLTDRKEHLNSVFPNCLQEIKIFKPHSDLSTEKIRSNKLIKELKSCPFYDFKTIFPEFPNKFYIQNTLQHLEYFNSLNTFTEVIFFENFPPEYLEDCIIIFEFNYEPSKRDWVYSNIKQLRRNWVCCPVWIYSDFEYDNKSDILFIDSLDNINNLLVESPFKGFRILNKNS